MRFAMNHIAAPKLSLEDFFAMARALGATEVEIRNDLPDVLGSRSPAEVKAADVPVEAVIEIGDAAGVLVEESKAASLAVVGSRGRGGFAGRLLGTVSSALPAHSACPTVVIPVGWSPEGERAAKQTASRPIRSTSGSPPS